jgi:hypothetical protein
LPSIVGTKCDPGDEVVAQLVEEMSRLHKAEAAASSAILAFVIIDAMAHIGRPKDAPKATGADFIAWVDLYMRVQEPAEYRYSGADLYAARCDLLHTFSNQTRTSKRNFGYHDGAPHRYRPDIDPNLVLLSVTSLAEHLWAAIAAFLMDKRSGPDYALVQTRFNDLFRLIPFGGKHIEQGVGQEPQS